MNKTVKTPGTFQTVPISHTKSAVYDRAGKTIVGEPRRMDELQAPRILHTPDPAGD